MKPIPITEISVNYHSSQRGITPKQFKGAFNAYLKAYLTDTLTKKSIPLNIGYNRDHNNKPIQRYPLIQFSTSHSTLTVVGIGKGNTVIALWLKSVLKNKDFTINGKPISLSSPKHTTQYWYPQITPQQQLYHLHNWKPFDAATLGDENRLDGIIWGNIHRMLGDLDIQFKEKAIIHLQSYIRKEDTKGYGIHWITYDAVFSTNINLAQHMGIGHEPSIGSGKIINSIAL